jgi:HEPN domain-containing protein
MTHNFPHQYEIYFQKATADLGLVQQVLTLENAQVDRCIILFHLQQAAEKYLKAILSFKGVHFGKLHDLETIIELCIEHSIELPSYVEAFVELAPYAVEGRYDIITDENVDIVQVFALLEQFKVFVSRLSVISA